MDLVNACRVFVQVGEHGSFTLGAAAARVPQSVASRRVAALEEHFGRPLFDRSTRRAALTAFGQEMLPSAKRLVQLAEALELHAQEAKLLPLSLAVPETCGLGRLARLDAAAREAGIILDVRQAGPAVRAELLIARQVRAALVAVPAEAAAWRVPLGLATALARDTDGATPAAALRLDALRPSRTRRTFRRIWIQPEDDVPHVRDPLLHAGHRAALLPAQIVVSASLVAAAGETLRSSDHLLCSAQQADDLGLPWRPLAGPQPVRGYQVSATTGEDAARIREVLGAHLADALGAQA
ncbi:MAG TPA: LysR family transcriptional regulator [Actinospica sp.]|nr:LysR family transcriptional regulator [Actinospica sp.]